ncbi:PadR family transcriptional regulator, partial [Streptosporangium algeriense]
MISEPARLVLARLIDGPPSGFVEQPLEPPAGRAVRRARPARGERADRRGVNGRPRRHFRLTDEGRSLVTAEA